MVNWETMERSGIVFNFHLKPTTYSLFYQKTFYYLRSAGAGIPEGEKLLGPVVIGGHNLPFPGWNMVN